MERCCAQCGYSEGHRPSCPHFSVFKFEGSPKEPAELEWDTGCRACTCPKCIERERLIIELVTRLALALSKHADAVVGNAATVERLLKRLHVKTVRDA